jgi:glycine C-acetyltransferase
MNYTEVLVSEIKRLQETKTYKKEIPLLSEQGGIVRVDGREVIMLASNNYLGLASHPRIKEAAIRGIKEYGYGVASVRFICGTQSIHKQLEEKISEFVGAEDTILFHLVLQLTRDFLLRLSMNRSVMKIIKMSSIAIG